MHRGESSTCIPRASSAVSPRTGPVDPVCEASVGEPTQEHFSPAAVLCLPLANNQMELQMNGLIYLIGLIVVIMVILSLLGLR